MKTSANTIIVNKIVNRDLASSSHMNQGLFKIQTRDIFNIQPTRQVSFKTTAKHTHVLSNGLTL